MYFLLLLSDFLHLWSLSVCDFCFLKFCLILIWSLLIFHVYLKRVFFCWVYTYVYLWNSLNVLFTVSMSHPVVCLMLFPYNQEFVNFSIYFFMYYIFLSYVASCIKYHGMYLLTWLYLCCLINISSPAFYLLALAWYVFLHLLIETMYLEFIHTQSDVLFSQRVFLFYRFYLMFVFGLIPAISFATSPTDLLLLRYYNQLPWLLSQGSLLFAGSTTFKSTLSIELVPPFYSSSFLYIFSYVSLIQLLLISQRFCHFWSTSDRFTSDCRLSHLAASSNLKGI